VCGSSGGLVRGADRKRERERGGRWGGESGASFIVFMSPFRPVTRRPLQPHPNALEDHHWSPRDGRVCGSSGGLVTACGKRERAGGGAGGGSRGSRASFIVHYAPFVVQPRARVRGRAFGDLVVWRWRYSSVVWWSSDKSGVGSDRRSGIQGPGCCYWGTLLEA